MQCDTALAHCSAANAAVEANGFSYLTACVVGFVNAYARTVQSVDVSFEVGSKDTSHVCTQSNAWTIRM